MENFQNFTFSRNIFRFSSAKISADLFCFFSQQSQVSNFPLCFCYFNTVPPLFRQNYSFPLPTFINFSPVFGKFTCFLHTLCVFRFPLLLPWCIYTSHNARTGRPYRVSASTNNCDNCLTSLTSLASRRVSPRGWGQDPRFWDGQVVGFVGSP